MKCKINCYYKKRYEMACQDIDEKQYKIYRWSRDYESLVSIYKLVTADHDELLKRYIAINKKLNK